jgi:cytidylate kinase
VRTSRRHLELASKGIDAEWDDIYKNLTERDQIDSSRADSPLRQADDATILDNTLLSEEEQMTITLEWVRLVMSDE